MIFQLFIVSILLHSPRVLGDCDLSRRSCHLDPLVDPCPPTETCVQCQPGSSLGRCQCLPWATRSLTGACLTTETPKDSVIVQAEPKKSPHLVAVLLPILAIAIVIVLTMVLAHRKGLIRLPKCSRERNID